MSAVHNTRWYALRTQARFEKVVHEQLMQRGIEPFLPLVRRVSQWKDRTKEIRWPLFAGYCFAKFSPEQQENVRQIPGVIPPIEHPNVVQPIPGDEIAALQQIISHGQDYKSWPYHQQFGTMVTVTKGPLRGLHGRLVRGADGAQLIIAVHSIQQAAVVTIAVNDVRALDLGSEVHAPSSRKYLDLGR